MKIIMPLFIVLAAFQSLYGQFERENNYSERLIYSYSANDTLKSNKTLNKKELFDSLGRVIKIYHYDSSELKQTVDLSYNIQGDLVEKTFLFSTGKIKS